MPLADWLPTRDFTALSSTSHARLTIELSREAGENAIGACQKEVGKFTSL